MTLLTLATVLGINGLEGAIHSVHHLSPLAAAHAFTSATHETIISAAFGWEAGGTGRKIAGAESSDLFKPAILFGKGLRDLPEALAWLRPFAVTGIAEGGC